jgi:predicted transcriptional regulator
MTAQAVIKQFKALSPQQRAEVAKFVVESDDSWIPDSFKQGMADAAAGRYADMETILKDAPPPSRRRAK